MARPLRIQRPNGRYHVTARGNERKALYRDETDRFHFLELLAEIVERYGVQVHAYVLMDNHFHLLLQTPEANLSRALQWLNVSYGVWFNRRHDRAGHLFQGRFKALVVEDDSGWQEVARYVHLNPVRVATVKLDKRQRPAARAGLGNAPAPQLIAERLRRLREYRWSSYRAYAGYGAAAPWLQRDPVGRLCGGRSRQEQQRALRQYTEQAVRQGGIEPPWSRLVGGLVLGTEAFAQALLRQTVSGHSNPARKGQMKTGHFESGIAHKSAIADFMRDEPTQREPATFHRHAGGQRLVGAQDCPRTGHPPRNGGPLLASGSSGRFKTGHSALRL
jgi:putative transposase